VGGTKRNKERETVLRIYFVKKMNKSIFNERKSNTEGMWEGRYLIFDIKISQGLSLPPKVAHAI